MKLSDISNEIGDTNNESIFTDNELIHEKYIWTSRLSIYKFSEMTKTMIVWELPLKLFRRGIYLA